MSNIFEKFISPAATAVSPDLGGESDKARLAKLAAMSPLEYDRCRTQEAKAMGVRPATLDALVKAGRVAGDEKGTPFAEPEPWSEPVDPAALLSELSQTIRRFIVLEAHQADAASLWVAFTWFVDVVEVAPLAIINAPEKACGKSQLLTLTAWLVARPLSAANSSPAFLFRAVEKWSPTVLIDEADTFIRDNEELKGLVNAGHTRQNAFVGRVVGDAHEPKLFNVWGAKALAGIALEKHLPDATMSRAIVFNMRRKLPGERVQRLRDAEASLFSILSSKLARFAEDCRDTVKTLRPSLPEALSDRAQDNWEPLLSIAECAGPEWLSRATRAALALSGSGESAQSAGNELLEDIRDVFESKHVERISTTDLIAALVNDEEGAWATYNRGRPLAPRQLGKMLKAYGIASKNVRLGYEQTKGFERAQFADAFSRYLSPSQDLSAQSVPMAGNQGEAACCVGRIERPASAEKTTSVPLKPRLVEDWRGGTDKTPVSEEGVEL